MKRLSSFLFCGLFLLPFAAFWACYWLDAPVPDPLGNTPLPKYPVLKKKQRWPDDVWMQKAARTVIARAPLRYRAIQLKNDTFSTTAKLLYPVPVNPGHADVCWGKDSWLFLLNEAPLHRSENDFQQMASRAVNLGHLVTKSGRRFFIAPFPDKVSIYPEYDGLVKQWAEKESNRAQIPATMALAFSSTPDLKSSYIPVWQALLQAKTKSSELLYWERDTHWNYAGMVVAARTLVNSIEPSLFEDSAVKPDGVSHGFMSGGGHDLSTIFLLQKGSTEAPKYAVHREGGDPDRQGQHFKSRQSRVIKGRTVIVNDSFAEWAAPLLTPWFEDLVFFNHESMNSPEMEKCLQESDTILWTSVERFLPDRLKIWEDYLGKTLKPKPSTP